MYIQLYAIPGQIILGLLQYQFYEIGSLYYFCFCCVELSLIFIMYNNSTILFPKCLWMIIPFQKCLTLLNFDMISVAFLPYLLLTDQINDDIIKRLPKKPLPPPRRTHNPQIDSHHSINIQNVMKQNARSLRKYEYFHICCISLCYIILPKKNCTRILTIQKTLYNC